MSSSAPSLRPVTLRLARRPGALLAQIESALAAEGQPLRWAITAVEPAADHQVGADLPADHGGAVLMRSVVLTIEAVVLA